MPSSTINKKRPLAVSIGEPAGIGPEIIIKSWLERQKQNLPPFFIIGCDSVLLKVAQKMGLDIPIQSINTPGDCNGLFQSALPVLNIAKDIDFIFGTPSPSTASMTLGAIEQAVDFFFDHKISGLVTAPIQKSVLYETGFSCPGHTEYLAKLCEKKTNTKTLPVMMLVSDHLRVVPLTIHMPLADVPKAITAELLSHTCKKISTALFQDFGVKKPQISVAGLNPHAGEDGTMGNEDEAIIRPALDALRESGMDIMGPLPGDTMFHKAAREKYDAALCMYHDQALIPIKTLDFDSGVNVTIGLPIVRTSPDHGTALNIAGKNMASPKSMINAILQAEAISQNRLKWAKKHV